MRAPIQLIPYVGGALDTLLAGAGTNWQMRRLEAFVQDLREKLEKIDKTIPELKADEDLFDFGVQVFNEVIRNRSEEKRKRFANIFTKQIVERHPWEEAETATRFMAELTEHHVEILNVIVDAPKPTKGVFQGVRVVTITDWDKNATGQNPLDLRKAFPKLTNPALQLYLSELLAKGLIYDEGANRWATKTLEAFSPTEVGNWFINWVKEYAESDNESPFEKLSV